MSGINTEHQYLRQPPSPGAGGDLSGDGDAALAIAGRPADRVLRKPA